MKNIGIIVLVLAIVLVGIFVVRKPSPAPTATNTEEQLINDKNSSATSSVENTQEEVVPPVASEKTFTVSGSNFKFEPSTITVNKGDKVTIIFKNTGGFHDWKIDEFGAATKQIQGGAEETITFVADKTGSFEYYCSVGTHRQIIWKV